MSDIARPKVDPIVFGVSAGTVLAFVAWGCLAPEGLASVAGAVLGKIIEWFGWGFVVSTAFFLAFSVFLAVSRFGKIRLGREDE